MSAPGILGYTQHFLHDPENGVYGDCWRATVASLLRLPIEEVPHVCDGPDDGKAGERMRAFLDSQDCALIQVPFNGDMTLEHLLAYVGSTPVSGGLHWCLMGTSRTGCNHVVICKGDEIVHDPSITQSGIVGPADDGFWWVEWIVKRSACDAVAAAPTSHVLPIELNGVSAALDYGKGLWRTCTGCHESNEGYPTGPYSALMKCHLGGGCFECGGIGAVWDTTDYEDMGRYLVETGWEAEEKLTVEEAWTILCETPDITSPEEYPDHALITMEQLGSFMARALPPAPQPNVAALEEQVAFTLSDASRLLRKQDVEGACPNPDDCFYFGDRVRCEPCAVKASAAKGIVVDDTHSHLPEVCRLRREVRAATARIAELEAAPAPEKHVEPVEIPGELEMFEGKLTKVVDASRTGWWRFHAHRDRDGYCDNPARGY